MGMGKNIKIIKSQIDTGVSAISAIGWLTEQGMQALMGHWWSKVPFLEIAIILGVFALGRNFHALLAHWREWRRSAVLKKSDKAIFNGSRALIYDVKFKRNFINPKISVEICSGLCLIGEDCCYERIGIVQISFDRNFNRGDGIDICLLWDPVNPPTCSGEKVATENNNDPRCMRRGANHTSPAQYRIKVRVTSENRRPESEDFEVNVPTGDRSNFLIGYTQPCMVGANDARASSSYSTLLRPTGESR